VALYSPSVFQWKLGKASSFWSMPLNIFMLSSVELKLKEEYIYIIYRAHSDDTWYNMEIVLLTFRWPWRPGTSVNFQFWWIVLKWLSRWIWLLECCFLLRFWWWSTEWICFYSKLGWSKITQLNSLCWNSEFCSFLAFSHMASICSNSHFIWESVVALVLYVCNSNMLCWCTVVKCVLIASPGFVKVCFHKYIFCSFLYRLLTQVELIWTSWLHFFVFSFC